MNTQISVTGSLNLADVAAEDIGNIFRLEHVNLTIPDLALSNIFYVLGMGFTRDPHFLVGPETMWINVGETQFHLPVKTSPQVLRGEIGIVFPQMLPRGNCACLQ